VCATSWRGLCRLELGAPRPTAARARAHAQYVAARSERSGTRFESSHRPTSPANREQLCWGQRSPQGLFDCPQQTMVWVWPRHITSPGRLNREVPPPHQASVVQHGEIMPTESRGQDQVCEGWDAQPNEGCLVRTTIGSVRPVCSWNLAMWGARAATCDLNPARSASVFGRAYQGRAHARGSEHGPYQPP